MLTNTNRVLLENYVLASSSLTASSGERLAKEVGQSVEFQDFRPYQSGDELRYVDWKVYGRTGKLYTRLYQAERNVSVHILLDNSGSMSLGNKGEFARAIAQFLVYAARRNTSATVHGFSSFLHKNTSHKNTAYKNTVHKQSDIPEVWRYIEEISTPQESEFASVLPTEAIKRFALNTSKSGILILVISDLFDETPLQQSLIALKARGFDVSFLQVMSQADLEPRLGQLELHDSESSAKLRVGPDEVRAYKQAVSDFLNRTRNSILQAGFRHSLLKVKETESHAIETEAFRELVKAGILIKR